MNRTFESNGPDVKIRGTASHIAEKYASLARDALSAGDNVMGENYLQHAEHYNRIVAAATAQNARADENANANSNGFGRGPQPDVGGFSDNGEGDSGAANEARGDSAKGDSGRADSGKSDRDKREQVAEEAQPTGEQPAKANDEGNDERPRREPRPRRRPRQTASQKANGNGNGGQADHEAEQANGDEASSRREPGGISPDASMLPESLVGKGSEGSVTETGAED